MDTSIETTTNPLTDNGDATGTLRRWASLFPAPLRGDWRIGLIGFGGIAGAHVEAYRSAGWPIVAVADPSVDALKRARDRLGDIRLYEDYGPLVADPEVEVVVVLTQPTIRFEPIETALDRGKPVLVEKPLAGTIEEAERIATRSDGTAIKVAVSQNYRYFPAPYAVRHLIRDNVIGRPYFAAIEIFGSQDRDLAGHTFYATCRDFLTVQWNNHLADLLRYWFDADPLRLITITRRMNEQNFTADNLMISTIDYGPGVTAMILHHELLRSDLRGAPCRIDGDKGSLSFDLWGCAVRVSTLDRPEPFDIDLSALSLPSSQRGTMGDLLRSVEEGKEPATSARANLPTLRHVFAEQRSAEAGGAWMEIDAR